jgi:F0F1-type ATP synthase assembly protein I
MPTSNGAVSRKNDGSRLTFQRLFREYPHKGFARAPTANILRLCAHTAIVPDEKQSDQQELGYYMTLAQVGLEMVAPVIVGLVADHFAGTMPWITLGGIVLGFVGGLTHLVMLGQKQDKRIGQRGSKRF